MVGGKRRIRGVADERGEVLGDERPGRSQIAPMAAVRTTASIAPIPAATQVLKPSLRTHSRSAIRAAAKTRYTAAKRIRSSSRLQCPESERIAPLRSGMDASTRVETTAASSALLSLVR
jgi:hypothetical protein